MHRRILVLIPIFMLIFLSMSTAFVSNNKVDAQPSLNIEDDFIKGADISTLEQLESKGARFYVNGVEKDLLEILKENGVNYIRLRLWNDPYDTNGNDYGAGNADIETVISLAKRAKNLDMKFLLDFHYSDFWADPGKQYKPKAWENLSF